MATGELATLGITRDTTVDTCTAGAGTRLPIILIQWAIPTGQPITMRPTTRNLERLLIRKKPASLVMPLIICRVALLNQVLSVIVAPMTASRWFGFVGAALLLQKALPPNKLDGLMPPAETEQRVQHSAAAVLALTILANSFHGFVRVIDNDLWLERV